MTISAPCLPKFFHHLTSHLPPQWLRNCGSLRPAQVLYTLMMVATRQNHGYKLVIDELKRSVGDALGWDEAPTASSFCEARRKLSVGQCRDALSFIRGKCTSLQQRKRVLYGDYRLVAVDMTKLALPAYADVRSVFGCPKGAKRRTAAAPQGTLTVLWDVSTNTPIDWKLEKVYSSESLAAQGLMTHLGANDLLIADRGYPSRQFFVDVAQQSAAYLVRMPIGSRGGSRRFMNSPAMKRHGIASFISMPIINAQVSRRSPCASLKLNCPRVILPFLLRICSINDNIVADHSVHCIATAGI